MISPSDLVGPSPVTSTGTATTEIEDEIQRTVEEVKFVPRSQLQHQSRYHAEYEPLPPESLERAAVCILKLESGSVADCVYSSRDLAQI